MQKIDHLMNISMSELEYKILEEFSQHETPNLKATAWTGSKVKAKLEEIKTTIEETFRSAEETIYQEICINLDYCRRVQEESNTMIALIADTAIILLFQIPISAVTLTAYILRLGYFDRLCDCKTTSPLQ